MAKRIRGQKKETTAQYEELNLAAAAWKKILEAKEKNQKYDERALKYLEQQYQTLDKLETAIEGVYDTWDDLDDKLKDINKDIKDQLEDFDDIEDTITSIGSKLGKQSGLYIASQKKLAGTKLIVESISADLQSQNDLSDKQVENIIQATKKYTGFQSLVASAQNDLKQNNITQSEYNDLIKSAYKDFDSLIDKIDDSTEAGKRLKEQLLSAKAEMASFSKAAEKSSAAMDTLDTAVDQLGSSGIPLVGELGTAFQKLANKDIKGAKAAITALGAAVGALAGKYFGADYDAAREAANDVKQTNIDAAKEVGKIYNDAAFIPQKIQQERNESALEAGNNINRLYKEAEYAAKKAANEFSNSMKMAGAQFQAASKTALFGKGIGSVNYGAAMLQTAGISAEQVASAMSSAAIATGKMPTAKMGSDMAVLAERTGQSSDDIATINESFQRIDGLSAKMAMNMQEGMRNMADQAGIDLGNLMKEVAESSKEALGYQIKSGPALAKAVAYTQSMGVNFGDVAKAGKNMVMNYKDSIKAEMQLSSLLGEQVDLSEVRAKFAAGDTTGALESLKAQGLNPEDMDMFQQQALQDALGGMDITSISKLNKNGAANVGNLQAGNVQAGNKQFLSTKVGAEAGLKATEAKISADQAIIDARLAEEINQAFLGSPEYLAYQKGLVSQALSQNILNQEIETAFQQTPAYIKALADSTKLQIERTFTENQATVMGGLIGGAVSNFLASKLGGGGIMNKLMDKGGDSILSKLFGGATGGSTTAGLGSKAAQFGSKAGPFAAAVAGIASIMKGSYNVATSEALNTGKGGGMQTAGNVISGIGAEFVNFLDMATFGATKSLAEAAGVSVRGVDTSKMEQARAAYRQQTGSQIGLGEEGNQKLVNWVMANKAYLSGKGGIDSTVKAFEEAIAAGKIKTTSVAASTADAKTAKAAEIPAGKSVTTAMADSNKWLQDKLVYMSGNLEKVVDRTSKTAANTAEMVTQTKTMNTNTKAILELTRKIEALTRATYEGGTVVKVDGKILATAVTKYDENNKAQNTTGKVTTGY
jgi:hypothetical protein